VREKKKKSKVKKHKCIGETHKKVLHPELKYWNWSEQVRINKDILAFKVQTYIGPNTCRQANQCNLILASIYFSNI
jgi:hypothetical protein